MVADSRPTFWHLFAEAFVIRLKNSRNDTIPRALPCPTLSPWKLCIVYRQHLVSAWRGRLIWHRRNILDNVRSPPFPGVRSYYAKICTQCKVVYPSWGSKGKIRAYFTSRQFSLRLSRPYAREDAASEFIDYGASLCGQCVREYKAWSVKLIFDRVLT